MLPDGATGEGVRVMQAMAAWDGRVALTLFGVFAVRGFWHTAGVDGRKNNTQMAKKQLDGRKRDLHWRKSGAERASALAAGPTSRCRRHSGDVSDGKLINDVLLPYSAGSDGRKVYRLLMGQYECLAEAG